MTPVVGRLATFPLKPRLTSVASAVARSSRVTLGTGMSSAPVERISVTVLPRSASLSAGGSVRIT